MPRYHYKGRDSQGKQISGEQEAPNELALAEQLMQRGIMPTAVTPAKTTMSSINLNWSFAFKPRVSLEELVMFTRQMYARTKSGVPILRAIHGLVDNARSELLRQALIGLKDDLGNGKQISVSMQSYPQVFNNLFVAIVSVGENTGRLDDAFRN